MADNTIVCAHPGCTVIKPGYGYKDSGNGIMRVDHRSNDMAIISSYSCKCKHAGLYGKSYLQAITRPKGAPLPRTPFGRYDSI